MPAVADPAGKRVARPPRHTVLILHIVLIGFWEKGDFSRPDAIFGLFFVLYELPDIPERITRYSGTNYQIFRNELPDIPTGTLVNGYQEDLTYLQSLLNENFDGVKTESFADNFFVEFVSLN